MTQPIRIHQFHPTASSADAVTNQMLFIRSALRDVGVSGDIFVGKSKAPASYGIRKFEPPRMWDSDLILIHHSHGNPWLKEILRVEIPKALVYHNVTPAEFFPHDPHLASFSDIGRRQLEAYAERVVASFAVSRFNAAELEVRGFKNPSVFPLLDLTRVPTWNAPRATLPSNRQALLFVGKLTPHKNQSFLIEIVTALEAAYPGRYGLVLAGRFDPLYGEYLKLLAKKNGIRSAVTFTGPVSQSELESHYLNARAFLCASLHEGFCVPVVEAMQRQLPVLALPTTGVRETLGRSGVRFTSRRPDRIAEAIDVVLSDARAVGEILDGQQARLEELAKIHCPERVQQLCLGLVDRLRAPKSPAKFAEVYT